MNIQIYLSHTYVLFIFYSTVGVLCVKLEVKMLFSIQFILGNLAVRNLNLLNVSIDTSFAKAKRQHMGQRDWSMHVPKIYYVDLNNRF